MSDLADEIAGPITDRLDAAAEQLAADIADDIRDATSEPYPPASEPFNPYHTRTGGTNAAIQNDSQRDGGLVTGTAFTDSEIAGFLENGTERMEPRPIWGPTAEKWEQIAVDRFDVAIDE